MQRIIWPWERKKWPEIKQNIAKPIGSIVEMDTRLSSIYIGKIRPRQIAELYNIYYNSDQYAVSRVSQSDFIERILPFMQGLITDAPKTFKGYDLYVLGGRDNVVLSRAQVATLIVGVWFGLFDYNYLTPGPISLDDMPIVTFLNIFLNQNIFALQCIMNYFSRVYQNMNSDEATQDLFNAGSIIVKHNTVQAPNWSSSTIPITEVLIGEGSTVDDTPAKLQTAFSYEYICGDNVFAGSLSQNEIMLLIRPECIAAALFCAKLGPLEAVAVIGAEKFSGYIGCGSSIRFTGNYNDSTPKGYSADETEAMIQSAVVFIDASPRISGKSQLIDDFARDLNKAYCGFSCLNFSKPGAYVASGNWAYGFNGNDMHIKFIQLVLAARMSDKRLIYHPAGREFEDRLIPFIHWLEGLTVGELFRKYISMTASIDGQSWWLNELNIFDSVQSICD